MPKESLTGLRDSLLRHLCAVGGGVLGTVNNSRAIIIRLCSAIRALAVQMGWHSIVPDLMGANSGLLSSIPTGVAMDLFMMIPEEAMSGRLHVDDQETRYGGRELSFRFFTIIAVVVFCVCAYWK